MECSWRATKLAVLSSLPRSSSCCCVVVVGGGGGVAADAGARIAAVALLSVVAGVSISQCTCWVCVRGQFVWCSKSTAEREDVVSSCGEGGV